MSKPKEPVLKGIPVPPLSAEQEAALLESLDKHDARRRHTHPEEFQREDEERELGRENSERRSGVDRW